jgi:Bacteriophage head to tail connecting protein
MSEIINYNIPNRFQTAKRKHDMWHSLWQDCYDYALPQRGQLSGNYTPANRRSERLYDATAMDAVDQLASLLLGNLTPPLTPWFGLKAGTELTEEQVQAILPQLEKTSRLIQAHFDQSNFIVEIHQSFLDLIVAGTASLAFEEAEPGELSAFHFTAIPLSEIILDEGQRGKLDTVFRTVSLTLSQILAKYEGVQVPLKLLHEGNKNPDEKFDLIECIISSDGTHGKIFSILSPDTQEILYQSHLPYSPFINFRWMKSPGEIYGRSPVMKTLPDIKTANKVVELILKNASISVTGIWQAEDDGVLNLANIELVPGAIISKAVGSKGLTPLEMPARFDVSQLILEDLRNRIRHALLIDRLPQIGKGKQTATEISIRSDEMSLLLGATFGRLQVELLNPLIQRAYSILRKRGVIPDLPLDGKIVSIDHRSPLARSQSSRNVQNTLEWISVANSLGPEIYGQIDRSSLMNYLTELLGVPEFIKPQSSSPKPQGE